MAKIYEDLKRIERERQQHREARAAAKEPPGDSVSSPVWRRWFGGQVRQRPDPEASTPSELVHRLETLVATQSEALDKELARECRTLLLNLTKQAEQLNARLSILLVVMVLALLALLFHR